MHNQSVTTMGTSSAQRVARLSLVAIFGVALTVGVVLTFLSITPPKPVARRILLAVSDRALFPPSDTGGAMYALHKLVAMYLEYTIAGKMARTAAARSDLHGDVARIAYVLERAQVRMLSAKDIPHDSQDWPVLVAGVGYCDQINAAVPPPSLPPPLPDAVATTPAAAPAPPPLPNNEAASRSIAKIYVRARADDLFGDPNDAKNGYRLVAAATGELDPTVKILQAAAQRFGQ